MINGIEEISKKVEGLSILTDQYPDGTKGLLNDICPFTAMGFFNRGIKIENRIKIAEEFAKLLKVKNKIPKSFDGLPILNNQRSWFFAYEKDRNKDDIEDLWRIFESAIKIFG